MKTVRKMLRVALAVFVACLVAQGAKKKTEDYQVGTFVLAESVNDGTLTNTVHGDGRTIAGSVSENKVRAYTIKTADGAWVVLTDRDSQDLTVRSIGWTPVHFTSVKQNPLDLLKNGDRVLFRVEVHRKIGGSESDIFVPFADNIDKEAKFVGVFRGSAPLQGESRKPTDNVKAICDSGRLSEAQQKQLCQ